MASAQVEARPQPDRPRKKPIAQWFKNLTSLKNKGSDSNDKSNAKKNALAGSKNKRHFGHNGSLKNNPYPQSGHHLQQRGPSIESSETGAQSFSVASRRQDGDASFDSLRRERDAPTRSNRSGAPTLATNSETVHSDAGYSKAATTTTRGGALSSVDGAGADSTFSSPRNSQHSLSTTLTTIQSTSPGTTLQAASGQPHPQPQVMFSHQYPVSPAPSGNAISAIPRHVTDTMPNTYNSATANNLLTDDASILTLASSSKRRRRSMDTDASVRALAPNSVFGGSRESLPLSVLSGNADAAITTSGGAFHYAPSRPSIGGLASAERASVYSNHGGALASERNSYYRPNKDIGDAKSLRSIGAMDSRSLAGDTRSMNADAKSLGGDVASLKGYESSIRSGGLGHARNDSIPGSIGSPLTGPNPNRHPSGTGLSRRSSDWADGERGSEHRPSLEEREERSKEEDEKKDAANDA